MENWNLKSTRPADMVKLLGSAATAGKSSSREGSMVVERGRLARLLVLVLMLLLVRSSTRMVVDFSPVQPGVPSSITTGHSPALLGSTFDLSFHFTNKTALHYKL